jgi:hypothetical protein
MALPNIFTQTVANSVIDRINSLKADSQAKWGKMSVAQMLAHCCVSYETVYENKHPKPNFFMKFLLKLFVKNAVVSETPYPKNSRTAPYFVITGQKHFETEKKRLITYIKQSLELGEKYFDGKESHSFGALTKTEWSNLFYKHLDHHLTQFGV